MKKIILVILIIHAFGLTSQNGIDNDKAHRRYWYYRTRLINDFIKIGKNQGDCMMILERNEGSQTSANAKVGSDQLDISNHYIMVLALEYKLLTRGNQSTDETIKEIWHMLYAINRLDKEANQFWTSGYPTGYSLSATGPLDGFLMREDVSIGYYSATTDNYNHFNYTAKLYDPLNAPLKSYTGMAPIYTTASNLQEYQDKLSGVSTETKTLAQMRDRLGIPTDKIHSMLAALEFVVKYIPSTVSYTELGNTVPTPFQDGATSIQQEAKNIANRLYNYMRFGFSGGASWILQYPDYTIPVVGNGHILDVGAFADIYSYPLSRMVCNVNHGFPFTYPNGGCIAGDPVATAGVAIYNAQAVTSTPSQDNAVFKAWDHVGSNLPAGLIPIAAAMQVNTTAHDIKWANLARIVLHQTDQLNVVESDYSNVIAQAPCTGPFNFSNGTTCNLPGCEFSSQDWLEHPDTRGGACPTCNNTKGIFTGNYPGVDYMLLHNLYYEYHNQLLFDTNYGNTGGYNATGTASNFGGGALYGNSFIFAYNLYANVVTGAGGVVNAVTTTACNALNSVSNFFGGSNVCSGTNIPPASTIPTGNSTVFTNLAYTGYNFMDNYDNSVWPKQIYSGPQPPNIPFGPFSNTNPSSPNNPNNPLSPYNPSNPTGYYSNPANFSFQGVLNLNRQAKVGMYQNLTSTAHIYATVSPAASFNTTASDVRYRAGKEITLLPGFEVDAGSNFYAYVQRYLCNGNGDDLNMRQVNPNDSTMFIDVDNNHYETDFVNQLPLHYVDYPKSDADLNPGLLANESIEQNQQLSTEQIQELVQQQLYEKQLADKGIYNTNKALNQRFLIMPNPNNGVFMLYVNKIADDEVFSYLIMDAKGQNIKTEQNINSNIEQQMDLSTYAKGIYLIQIISNKGFNASKKINVN